jgi:3-oxoacyl-[acyl-carrier protein] reductase
MRSIIVTGGSRGLGLGIGRTLAASGFAVYAVARKLTGELTQAIDSVTAEGSGALHFRCCDLTDLASLGHFVRSIRTEGGPIYGLVNNAGLGTPGLASQIKDEDIDKLVCLNVTVPLLMTKQVLKSMLPSGQGRIVNISSIVGVTGYSGLSAYSATKAALNGFIDTDMTHSLTAMERGKIERRSALRRMAEVSDVANMVDYLMSEKARNITGTVMTVDAGNTA